MKQEPSKTRTQQHEIEIDAPIEAVWKAITDAEELTRWFSEEARVTPGQGGTFWVSFGEGQAGECVIETWEPARRLRLRMLPVEGSPGAQYDAEAANYSPMFQEYTLESRGGRTVLRLVHSGIPDSPEWDGFYDGTDRGWEMFFRGLRHYLEKHPGKPRKIFLFTRPITEGYEEAWQKLTGPEGLAASGTLAGLDEGERYRVTTSSGGTLEGTVIVAWPPKTLVVTIDDLNNALLSATLEEMEGRTYFYLTLAVYGSEPKEFERISSHWGAWLDRMFPAK